MEKLIVVALLLVTVPYSGMVNGNPSVPSESDPNMPLLDLSIANTDFALRFYRQIAAHPSSASKNIFFSPLSISAALSMLSLGAKQNTLAQIMQVLGYSNMSQNGDVAVRQAFQHLLQELTSESQELHLGNSLHVQNGLSIKEKFIQEAKQFYNAEINTVNFLDQQNTKEQINAYVNNKTHGKIPDFLKEPLDQDTLMLLLNYVLFKGTWLKPFDAENTYEDDFHVDDRTTVKVQMMKRRGMYHSIYAEHLSCHVIKIPYQGNTSLVLLLPNPGKLAEVEKSLTIDYFQPLLFSLQLHSADLHLPKLSLKTSYQLKNLLVSMGIEDAFTDHANFSGISETPMKLSKVIHQAVLDVDEKGTEASAVTGIEIMPMSVPHLYKFNRPFLLLIAEHNVKSVLFAGRVMNPNA